MRPALVIATLVPLAVLAGSLRLDRQRGQLVLVVLALGWGVASTLLAGQLNDDWVQAYGAVSLAVVGAPIIEEMLKAAVLPVLASSRRCTWFVDGAVIGLASGTGFAIRENLLYLQQAPTGTDVSLALARVTSTNLMHAGCTAIIGVGIAVTMGLAWWRRLAVGVACLGTALALHSLFNHLAGGTGTAAVLTLLGIGVFVTAAAVVAAGSPLSRRWAVAAMAARGHNKAEQSMMGSADDVAELLDRFEARFGAHTAGVLEELIDVQRRIGVLSHTSSRKSGSRRSGDGTSITALDELVAESDVLRRQIGIVAMGWLRSHLPSEGGGGMWASLADATPVSPEPPVVGGVWAALADRESSPPRDR